MDRKEYIQKLQAKLKEVFGDAVEGAAIDIDRFFAEISIDLAEAAALGDDELVTEIGGQIEALAEKHRLTLARETFGVLRAVMEVVGAVTSGFVKGMVS